jgi:hypothetical protein
MIRKSGNRFSEKIMLKQLERDDDSKISHPALGVANGAARWRETTAFDLPGPVAHA